MNKLHEFNKDLVSRYNKLSLKKELSFPLIVSSNEEYIKNLNNKVLYIGQETNGWGNYDDESKVACVDELEAIYYNFLVNRCGTNTEYWRFIRSCFNINREDLSKNVLWSNLFIAGKRTEKGNPPYDAELEKLSLENLLFLYDYFKPKNIVIVGGPKEVYYNITIKFLNEIKSNLISFCPNINNPLLIDEDKNIFWTYHPTFQNKKHIKEKIIDEINSRINV